MPRRKNLWLLGGGHSGFNGNTKFLFLYLTDHRPDIQSVWIANSSEEVSKIRQQGFASYCKWSVNGLLLSLRASVYFTNNYSSDINFFCQGKALYFNLWHGVGLKQIEFGITEGIAAKAYDTKNFISRFYMPYHFKRPDFFLSTSRAMTRHFAKSFRINEEQCLELNGYPRNQLFYHSIDDVVKWINKNEPNEVSDFIEKVTSYKRSIIYMPTWRDKARDFISDTGIDFKRLNEVMKQTETVFIFKLHPATPINFSVLDQYSNLMAFDALADVYVVLPFIDLLITDYSSIYHDFILLKGKQVLLYPYDLDRTKNKELGIALEEEKEYEKLMPGVRIYDFNSLCESLLSQEKFVPNNLEYVTDFFWGTSDARASQAIVNFVMDFQDT